MKGSDHVRDSAFWHTFCGMINKLKSKGFHAIFLCICFRSVFQHFIAEIEHSPIHF